MEAVDKAGDFPQRKGRVCAGNPRRVSCAIEILSFQNFIKVLKTCSAGRKDFFDTLNQTVQQDGPMRLYLRLGFPRQQPEAQRRGQRDKVGDELGHPPGADPVSYTHLTLPTIA